MQIVIELPDKVVARIRSRHGHCGSPKYGNGIWTDDLLTVSTAIYFGKILPKGHGDLKDVNDIIRNNKRWAGYLDDDMIARLDIAVDKHVKTIVPADNEVDE